MATSYGSWPLKVNDQIRGCVGPHKVVRSLAKSLSLFLSSLSSLLLSSYLNYGSTQVASRVLCRFILSSNTNTTNKTARSLAGPSNGEPPVSKVIFRLFPHLYRLSTTDWDVSSATENFGLTALEHTTTAPHQLQAATSASIRWCNPLTPNETHATTARAQ